jgi:hypothetical protein
VPSGATARSSTALASHRASTCRRVPVLSVGTTPHTPLDAWTFRITGAINEPVLWTWEELRARPAETPTVEHPLRNRLVKARHHVDGRLHRRTSTTVSDELEHWLGGD